MSTKKVLAFTGIRSDYDLMSHVYKRMNQDDEIEIGLIVSGAHLSETYGYSYQNILNDNIPVVAAIESLLDSNSKSSRVKSMSVLLQSCIHSVQQFNPDLIMYAGDREDVMAGGLIGAYLGIPTAHFFGGDHATDGHVDNLVRHATSKLSSLHFVSNHISAERLVAIGEPRKRIFNVGSPALDKFKETEWLSKQELLCFMEKEDWDDYAILIYHPVFGGEEHAAQYFREILQALDEEKINTFISYPNVDSGSKSILSVLEDYKANERFSIYNNLPRFQFVNLLRHASFLIGNSSAGLYEAPSIPMPAVNVGERQRGRLAAENVLFVDQGVENVIAGIREAINEKFIQKLKTIESPYGNGGSSQKIVQILKSIDFKKYTQKREDPLGEN